MILAALGCASALILCAAPIAVASQSSGAISGTAATTGENGVIIIPPTATGSGAPPGAAFGGTLPARTAGGHTQGTIPVPSRGPTAGVLQPGTGDGGAGGTGGVNSQTPPGSPSALSTSSTPPASTAAPYELPSPAPERGGGIGTATPAKRVDTRLAGIRNRGLRVTEVASGKTLMDETNGPITWETTIPLTMTVDQHFDGADIHVTYNNSTNQARNIGRIFFSGIRLADRIEILDLRHAATWHTKDRANPNLGVFWSTWPGDLYSPVAVLRDSQYTMGFSIQYPALEYKHGVRIDTHNVARWNGDTGPSWAVTFLINSLIQPGESRTYTFSYRFLPRSESWLKTLVPYRDYFRATYGPVQYTRDPRPVTAVAISEISHATPSNPRAFTYTGNNRPDVFGWRPWAVEIANRRSLGYQRTMVWAAAGLYTQNRDHNYPPNSLSPMDDLPMMRTTKGELANAAGPNMQVGYWLGYSTNWTTGWDTNTPMTRYNLNSETEKANFWREIDFAASLNSTLIGLDAFVDNDPYFLVSWLRQIKARHPQMKFIAEVSPPDIIHNLAGSFLFEWDAKGPPVLADFINPGHETWLACMNYGLIERLGRRPTAAEATRELQEWANMGYVPLDFNIATVDALMLARRSWETTIPAELRMPVTASATPPATPPTTPPPADPPASPPPAGGGNLVNIGVGFNGPVVGGTAGTVSNLRLPGRRLPAPPSPPGTLGGTTVTGVTGNQ